MGRTLAIFSIVGSVLAGLSAFVLADLALLVPALFGIVGGIMLAISKDLRRLIPGILAAVFAILGILGTVGSVGGEDGSVEFPISVGLGVAFMVLSGLMFPASALARRWGDDDPEWLAYIQATIIGLGVLFALIFQADLTDHAAATTVSVGVLALGSLWSGILALRDA